jgi:hypothetical protein
MKSLLYTWLTLAALTCSAQEITIFAGPDTSGEADQQELAGRGKPPPDLWRQIDGVNYYIPVPGFNYFYKAHTAAAYHLQGNKQVLATGWFLFCGKVLQVHADGIRVQGFCNWTAPPSAMTVFVVNYPYPVAEDDIITWHAAREAGNYTYTTVMGSTITLHKLDYGAVISSPAAVAPILSDEQIQQAQAALSAKKVAEKAKILAYDKQWAAKGDSYSERRHPTIRLREQAPGCKSEVWRADNHPLKHPFKAVFARL